MNKYITSQELTVAYPQAEDFAESQVEFALKSSASLVDSFLDTKLIPLVSKRFTEGGDDFPAILKNCQIDFARYVLEKINNGWTEELQSLYDNTANVLSKITANELSIPDVNLSSKDIGWKVVTLTTAAGDGFAEVRGASPNVRTRYTLNFTNTGVYSIVRDDGVTVVTGATVSYVWKNPFSNANWPSGSTYADTFEVRFSGVFANGDQVIVIGTPIDNLNTSPSNEYITSGNIIYW